MNNHYIPCLLLKQFATNEKVNSYDFTTNSFSRKKLKNTFVSKDIFDEELERAFATKIEGPFGDLLNHKLLRGDTITINRNENLLIRKFLMINSLRAPIVNTSWDEMVERTKQQLHPSVQAIEFLIRHNREWKEIFENMTYSKEIYIPNLKKAMEIDSLEELADSDARGDVSFQLKFAARHAMVTTIAFWDCTELEQEFILPKLPGISQMDNISIFHKYLMIRDLRSKKEKYGMSENLKRELGRLEYGSSVYMDNFSIYPISPTRVLICFSPYFRAFYPITDPTNTIELYPPLLKKEQFDRHFFEPMRLELFEPCKNIFNRYYQYSVKKLKEDEVQILNAHLLDMETEEFIFHDFNRIRDSFWYYDKKAKFSGIKKHNFSQWI